MTFKPDKAFILAAGMGTRLRPMTDSCPKPLVKVADKPILEYVLDDLAAAGVQDVTINTHYLATLIETSLARRSTAPQIHFSREDKLMNTGGGIKAALAKMGDDPFYVVSGDSFWTDGEVPALTRMAEAWDSNKMDILLLLQPVSKMTLTRAVGDYNLNDDGSVTRSMDQSGEYMWTSVRICKPEIFDNTSDEPFSFLELLDKADTQGRLHAIVHDGEWHHISTPADLNRTDEFLRTGKVKVA